MHAWKRYQRPCYALRVLDLRFLKVNVSVPSENKKSATINLAPCAKSEDLGDVPRSTSKSSVPDSTIELILRFNRDSGKAEAYLGNLAMAESCNLPNKRWQL